MINLNHHFIAGLGLGTATTYLIRKIIDKYIDQKFNKDNLKFKRSIDRYEKLYCPLVIMNMGIIIESAGKISFVVKLELIIKGLLKKDLNYVHHIIKFNDLRKNRDYYHTRLSSIDFSSMQEHINKYHKLADPRLLSLLDSAIASEKEKAHIRSFNRSIGKDHEYDDSHISSEFHKLLIHIDNYSKVLNKKLFY